MVNVGDAVIYVEAVQAQGAGAAKGARRLPALVIAVDVSGLESGTSEPVVSLVHVSPHEIDSCALGRLTMIRSGIPFASDPASLTANGAGTLPAHYVLP